MGPRVTPTTLLSLSTPAWSFFRASMVLLKCSCLAIACVCTAPPLLQEEHIFQHPWMQLSNIPRTKRFSSAMLDPLPEDSKHFIYVESPVKHGYRLCG